MEREDYLAENTKGDGEFDFYQTTVKAVKSINVEQQDQCAEKTETQCTEKAERQRVYPAQQRCQGF